MNKTLQEIINSMIGAKEVDPVLSVLNSPSKVSIWRHILEAVAFVIFNFQEVCNLFLKEIDEKIANQKVPGLRWYRSEALRFQYGFDLLPESNQFSPEYEDNGVMVLATSTQVEDSKIIKYAAVTRHITNNGVSILMKIAGVDINEVVTDQKALAFTEYIEEIQAVGDKIVIVNYLPDILKLQIKVCYDPLVLLDNGMNILTAQFPVKDAIDRFMKNLPFNGELSVQKLEAAILEVSGVNDLQNISVESKWIVPGVGYGLLQPIAISKIPVSGRFKIEDWTGIEFINYQAV